MLSLKVVVLYTSLIGHCLYLYDKIASYQCNGNQPQPPHLFIPHLARAYACLCIGLLPLSLHRAREIAAMCYSHKLSTMHPLWHFWVRGSTWPGIRRRAMTELLGEPKVSRYDGTIGSNKGILWLEVAIDNTRGMQALDALNLGRSAS